MNAVEKSKRKFHFLENGGEMGALTREFNWSNTIIGPFDTWPQALKATVGIILHSDFPMFLWWGEEMIQFYNDAYRPSLGEDGKHPKALGQYAADCWPEIWDVIYPLINRVKTTGKSFFSEDQLIPIFRNGKIEDVYWTFSYSAVIGNTGYIDGVLVVCNETTKKVNTVKKIEQTVTDLNLAKLKIEQSERNFRNMVLQAPVAMCIMMGPDHVVEVANDLMIELWGKSKGRVMGKPIFQGLPEAKEQGLEQLLSNVYRTGETYKAAERPVVLNRKGKTETVYQNFVYEPYRDSDGSILGVLAITIDVTEQVIARQKIEEIVKERTESLRQSNAELSQFAYITSHDLQEPARKISTFVEMLSKSLGYIDPRSKIYLDKIDNSATRMLRLIRGVLSISQLSEAEHRYEKVDLNKVLHDVQTDFELLIEEKKCIIENTTLPVISAIPVQMSQLFNNLISNALKFSQAEKPCVQVTSRILNADEAVIYPAVKRADSYVQLSFMDNGIGFDQSSANQIFDIFKRLHSKSEYSGTGIGLALCKKIVENHGGQISAISSPGNGATFIVVLPLHKQ